MAEYAMLQVPARAIQVDPDLARQLPPSSQRVFDLLREASALSHPQIAQATGLPPRTVRFAIRRLRDAGLVESVPSLLDCRTRFVFISRRHIEPDALAQARRAAEEQLRSLRSLVSA